MQSSTRKTALTAILAAVSVVLLFLGSVTVIGDMALCAVAGYVTAVGVLANGKRWALAQFAVAGLLALLILPSKFAAIVFIAFTGWYPIAKSLIERKIRRITLVWFSKLVIFNVIIQVYIAAVKWFALADPETLGLGVPQWIAVIAFNVVCILYDISIYSASILYERVRRRR
jgi:hypothetical protein